MKSDEQLVPVSAVLLNIDRLIAPTTLSVLIMDMSTSMRKHGKAPIVCINQHVANLRNAPSARERLVLIMTFSRGHKVLVPLALARDLPLLDEEDYRQYWGEPGTLLWRTVKHALVDLNRGYQALSTDKQALLRVCVGVISDGEDSISPRPRYPKRVQEESAVSRALGFELIAYGLGINGRQLARDLGFSDDDAHAVSAEATSSGLADLTEHFTRTTIG